MRKGVLTVALLLSAALIAPSAARPADAAPPGPVRGPHVAFRATPFGAKPVRPPVYERWWFSGTQTDQVSKLAGRPTATFTRQAPTGATDLVQAGSGAAGDEDAAGDRASVFWRAPYRGTIDGDLLADWYWTSVEPNAQLRTDAIVSIYADTDVGSLQTRIARATVDLRVAADRPVLTRSRIPVRGRVERSLLIQVTPRFIIAAPELRVLYGSVAHPSGFWVPRSGGSDRPVTEAVPFTGERLDVQTVDIGHEGAEPTMGVDRRGNAFYVAAAYENLTPFPTSTVMRSFDGGVTWDGVSPNVGGETIPPFTGDPYLHVDPITDRVFSIDLYLACSYLLYSDDRGESWSSNPLACGDPADDHQTLVTGVRPPGVTMRGDYPTVIYYCFNQVVRSGCTRSVDGGLTFVRGRSDPYPGVHADGSFCGGLHGRAVTDSRGRLFLPKGHCKFPWVAVSEDGGDTWRRAQVSKEVSAAGVDVQAAVDEADNVYVVWWDEEFRLPWMAVSRDHGATWGEPLLIAPPGVRMVNFPSIAAGAPGRVAVSFPGTTSEQDTRFRPWNAYVVVTTNALDPRPVFQSAMATRPEDPLHRGPCIERCGLMLDFLHAVVAPQGEAWATFIDTCTEDAECITNDGSRKEQPNVVSPSAVSLAVRQVCGPALRGPARNLSRPGCQVVGAPSSSGPRPPKTGRLPRTLVAGAVTPAR